MVMMCLALVGMSQCTTGAQHDKYGIHQRYTADDGALIEILLESFHVLTPARTVHQDKQDYRALVKLDPLIHELVTTVYLRVLTDATV